MGSSRLISIASSCTLNWKSKSNLEFRMAEQNPKGFGRGRGLALQLKAAQARAAAAAAAAAKEAEEAQEKKEVGTPRRTPVQTPSASTPVKTASPMGARSSPMAARASPLAAAGSPMAARASPLAARASPVATPQTAPTGRGRGLLAARLAAQRSARQVGEVKDVSFRSEEFETSSKIGEVFAKPVDPKVVAGKLEKLDLGSPSVSKPSSVGSPSVSGSRDRAVRSILKSPTPEGTPEEGSLKSSSEGKPQYYRGIGGKSMEIAVNYMKLEQAEGYGIFEYEVRFDPPVDSRAERYSAVNEHRTLFGPTKSFDGNKLYLPKQLPDIET